MIDKLFRVFRGLKTDKPAGPGVRRPAADTRGSGSLVRDELEVSPPPEPLSLDEARLCHLASLGLNLAGKRVLEVGSGIGLRSGFFESLGCSVTCTDSRPENVRELSRRYPHRTVATLDLDQETALARFGQFDIIFCYGALHQLSKPDAALRALAAICTELILLECCISPTDDDTLHDGPELAANSNPSAPVRGCRPSRPWVMRRLKEHFGHAYLSVSQPAHPDFERNWLWPAPRQSCRAVFVGAKRPLYVSTLSDSLCDLQNAVPDLTRGIWVDVGAHLGETTFQHAAAHAGLTVYAFEPNLELASQRFSQLPNYVVLPLAVAEQDGFARFHLNANSAASSLLPLDLDRLHEWTGGADLQTKSDALVPTIRLDSWLKALWISRIDYLKIDTQGADFAVLRSAGDRLQDIRRIKLEVAVTPTPLYQGAASKDQIVRYLAGRGFALIAEQPQAHGQEENLGFFRIGPAAALNLLTLGYFPCNTSIHLIASVSLAFPRYT